jgi:hypothetical protein
VATREGLVRFPLHTALIDHLRRVREGTEVLIRYTGRQTSKGGRVFKAFEVYVAGDDVMLTFAGLPAEPTTEVETPDEQP